ncbi:hypothetical protein [Halobaculum sp. P14]|uniref:hypothetical protein n=1 Tax=Halobaculum sp. P14 TaxID=3421638 RepID=UPI003EB73847
MSRRFDYRARTVISAAALCLAVTATRFGLAGAPVPRPLYVFAGFGAAATLLLAAVLTGDLTRGDRWAVILVALTAGAFVRLSGFISVVTSGIDHYLWMRRVEAIVATGSIPGGDMYSTAAAYFVFQALGRELLALQPFGSRFLVIFVASITPLVVFCVSTALYDDVRVALASVVVASAHFLLFRTSALLEPESLAIFVFCSVVFLLGKYIQGGDRRFLVLLGVLGCATVFIHFMYALVIAGTAVGVVTVVTAYHEVERPDGFPNLAAALKATVATFVAAVAVILTSRGRRLAVAIFGSGFDNSTDSGVSSGYTDRNAGGGSGSTGGGSAEGSGNLPKFLPENDVVGRSIGAGSWGGPVGMLLTFSPMAVLGVFGGLGAVLSALRRRKGDVVLLALAVTVVGPTVLLVSLDLMFNIGYRLYYFVGVVLALFAAVLLAEVGRREFDRNRSVTVVVLTLFLCFSVVGPMSPLGNNVDPRFGGTDWRFTEAEVEQLQSFDRALTGDEYVTHAVPQVAPGLAVKSTGRDLILTRSGCWNASKIAAGGSLSVCLRENSTAS